ncbi:hypothetical protein M5K25_026831 [Dendrobium thyrsiflorum]|uniref:Uncharacterized protein n=1 Tax=Dendrobium thyrsiflorum TaxID=117978 RepID=A0ABD0TYF5_DENTH
MGFYDAIPLFVDTNLGTHFALSVSQDITAGDLKVLGPCSTPTATADYPPRHEHRNTLSPTVLRKMRMGGYLPRCKRRKRAF